MTSPNSLTYATPFELGNGNQTTTWAECIAFYERLAERFPDVLRWWRIGTSDTGLAVHAGLVTADGLFDRDSLRAQGRPVFFNNNGIHAGEPEGIDACMALVRDFCLEPERLSALGDTVFLFIPVYNVDGCVNRQATSRANQLGPESFGFRGNGLHLDLNRDFIKCDSLAAQVFNRFFTAWDPDVMVDTHTSNGADYAYTMTLIATQPDKLGSGLGDFLRERMLPAIYGDMQRRGWPTCPYVNLLAETPDEGIEDFLDLPRFSTGYAALVTGSFVAMAIGPGQLWLIAVGAVLFDLGAQATLIAHQTIIYSLEPAARSRLNAVLFVGMFIGMAMGSWLGSLVLAQFGWQGVCVMAALFALAALGVRMLPHRKNA
jgi:hypothetical protein